MRPPLCPPEIVDWRYSDGYAARGRVWRPPASPRGHLLYLHGIQSHGGWYEHSASVLAQAGYGVILPDRRGSGMNQAARGDAPSSARLYDDLEETIGAQQSAWGVAPVDVVAVSWGARLALAWLTRRVVALRRLLLIAPGLFPTVGIGIVERGAIACALATQPTRLFPIPLDDPALFTQNQAGQAFIADDPLKLTSATARFLFASARLEAQLKRLRRSSLAVSTELWLAGRDRIIRNDSIRAWVERVARPGFEPAIRTFEQASHTLEFEADPTQFLCGLRDWATQHLGDDRASDLAEYR